MNPFEILSNLKIDLSIKSRILTKNILVEKQIKAIDLIHFINISDERTQVLFTCVLDFIIEHDSNYLDSDLDSFIKFQENCLNETCKRVTSRIVYHLLLDDISKFNLIQKEKLIQIHFDWLITDSLVATRVNCISILFLLKDEASWIQTDLIAIINQQILLQEPSFVSRAKKILKKIHPH